MRGTSESERRNNIHEHPLSLSASGSALTTLLHAEGCPILYNYDTALSLATLCYFFFGLGT